MTERSEPRDVLQPAVSALGFDRHLQRLPVPDVPHRCGGADGPAHQLRSRAGTDTCAARTPGARAADPQRWTGDPRGQGGNADDGRGPDPARRHGGDAALGRHDQPAHLGAAGGHDRIRRHRLRRRRNEAAEPQSPRTEHSHQGRRPARAGGGGRLLGHDDPGITARSRPRDAVRQVAAHRHRMVLGAVCRPLWSSARPMR